MSVDKNERICANCTAFLVKVGQQRNASHMSGQCRITGAIKFQPVKGDEWCRDGFENKHAVAERGIVGGEPDAA